MKEKTLSLITEPGIVAIIRGFTLHESLKTAEALIRGGIKAIETTSNTKGATAIIENLVKEFGQEVVVGAGTVLNDEHLQNAINAGASFILSPSFDSVIIEKTLKAGLVSIPGAFSPTEAVEADRAGADIIKIFPVSSVGPQYIKDLKAPLNNLKLMPVGGVNLDNAAAFIKAGSIALGVGSSLVPKELIEQNRFDELAKLAAAYVQKVREARL